MSIDRSGKGVEVLISWGGYVFHTCRHVPNRPTREVLTVINLPPPHFGEGSFITVHRQFTVRKQKPPLMNIDDLL